MNYRKFGKLDWNTSALGFGCMRFPTLAGDNSKIDEVQATEMVRYAIDGGVNYIDTAWGYHREQSEPFVGRALGDGYRDKVKLATKMPSWLVKKHDDLDRFLDTQLERLQTDHIDFYLLHTLNAEYWQTYQDLDVFSWAEKKMVEGKFKHLGFSFHDKYPVFEQILNGYDNWTFCQIQYNYMDINEQAGRKGLQQAAEKGLAVVVMEPLRGGSLAQNPAPPAIDAVLQRSARAWTPADWALQWLWNQPEVSLLLSGMSTLEQVEQNLAAADVSGVGTLTGQDLAVVEDLRATREGLAPIPCTQCEYCLPCPNGVEIPKVFAYYNNSFMYQNPERQRSGYKNELADLSKADMCIACGECEPLCPQGIPIIDWLEKAHSYLTQTDETV